MNNYLEFEDDPIKDIDLGGAGDEVAYEDEQQEMFEHYRFDISAGQVPMRVDKYLATHMEYTSRHRIQLAIKAEYIRVNEKIVKANYVIRPGDVIKFVMPYQRRGLEILPEAIPLNIVHEDEDVLVLDKEAGLVVHPGCGNFSGTLVNALAWHLKDDPRYDPNDPEVGLVHRIDKDTSGLLVVAKTPEAKTSLCKQFFYHTTRRLYNALVWGPFAEDEGTITGNIGRDPKDRLRMAVFPEGSDIGKHAVTHWRVLERFGPVTLVECRLEAGRTHQIRAHMRHMGHPLFADERYGGDQILRGEQTSSYKAFIRNCMDLCSRQALHARTLGFQHPTTGEEMDFQSELSSDMMALIEKWRKKVNG